MIQVLPTNFDNTFTLKLSPRRSRRLRLLCRATGISTMRYIEEMIDVGFARSDSLFPALANGAREAIADTLRGEEIHEYGWKTRLLREACQSFGEDAFNTFDVAARVPPTIKAYSIAGVLHQFTSEGLLERLNLGGRAPGRGRVGVWRMVNPILPAATGTANGNGNGHPAIPPEEVKRRLTAREAAEARIAAVEEQP